MLTSKDTSYELSWAKSLSENYNEFDNEDILKYWVVDECGSHCVADLDNFWQNCLVLISDMQNHPRLVWGPHPTFSTTHFKLYRAVSQTPLAHPELQASLIATLSSTTYSYVDTDLHLHESGDYVYYFIKAYNSSNNSYSSITNVINTRAYFNKINPIAEQGYSKEEFRLSENYPNPFNPSTKIQFIIPEEGRNSNNSVQTKLIVYDALGREVKTLFNDSISPGTYTIDFNAVGLPSGVYYYSLTAGTHRQTKKMVVIK